MTAFTRPARAEAADYYHKYIDRVGDGDIRELLARQRTDVMRFLRALPPGKAGHRYAEGKWTIAEVVGHLNDCERLFVSRAFWFARGLEGSLPSFDQNLAMAASDASSTRSALVPTTIAGRAASAGSNRSARFVVRRNRTSASSSRPSIWFRTSNRMGPPWYVRSCATRSTSSR